MMYLRIKRRKKYLSDFENKIELSISGNWVKNFIMEIL